MTRQMLGAIALMASVLAGGAAQAQDGRADLARRELLAQAESARASGNHGEALRLGLQAAEIRATPSLRLMLAQEHRSLGHIVDALDQASACVREATADAGLRNRETILTSCRSLAAEVEAGVGRLVVDVTPRNAAGLRVVVGDAELPRVLLGVATPTAPGALVVRVEAEGMAPTTRRVTLRARETETVRVELQGVAVRAVETASTNVPGDSQPTSAPAETRSSTQRTLGWVALTAGLVGLGVGIGGVFYRDDGARAYNENRLPNGGHCPGSSYTAAPQPFDCQGYLDQVAIGETMQWAGLIGGGVLSVTGLILMVSAPASATSRSARVRCGVGTTGLGLNCVGSF